jgi:hypothetical protein
MNSKLTATTAILALAIASITLVFGLSQTDKITAADAPKGNAMYPFAEDVNPRVTFKFRDATVTHDFQLISQTSGFGNSGRGFTPEFTLQKTIGDTPYLHKAVDETTQYSTRSGLEYAYREFDVTIDIVQGNQVLRTLDYSRCGISNYKINTEFDKAESFTGRDAFALLEQYTFTCAGYVSSSPMYDQMVKEQQNKKPYM